jgi:RimJ/RimL family protein N-acetyltransferase
MTDVSGNRSYPVPVIETERLRLRAHRREDLAASVAMWGDPEVTRHIGGRPFSEEETWTRLLRCVGHWPLFGYGYWLVEDRATGKFVGEAGFAEHMRDIQPPLRGTPECGWAFIPAAHGKGIATETVHAMLAWGDATLREGRTVCLIDVGNTASIRVAQKCGYTEQARTTYKAEPVIIFERSRSGENTTS